MKSAHRPATTRSEGRRLGDRFRERLRIGHRGGAPHRFGHHETGAPGPGGRGAAVGRWRKTAATRAPHNPTSSRHGQRMLTNFGIRHAHAPALGQHLEEPSPDPVGVPDRVRDEMLKALVGDRVRDTGQHRLHRFPIAVAEHAVHVRLQREPLRTMAEAALKRFEPANQALHANGRRAIDHRARSVPNSRDRYKVFTIHENIPEYVAGSDKVALLL